MMTNISIFDFSTYKAYLRARIGDSGQRKGQRSKLASALGCQPTFVTQVLNKDQHFSLEHLEKVSRFLGHSEDEEEFLYLLAERERAGTKELRVRFENKIRRMQESRQVLTKRLGAETVLSPDKQHVYYSSWHYSALHIAVAVPALRTREALSQYFSLPIKKVTEVLEYLSSAGLVVQERGEYRIGPTKIRLGKDSPNILRHHGNWRIQALESLDREGEADLHYSGVLCLSKKDQAKIKSKIFEALQEHLAISDASAEEEICCYNIDLFSLTRS